MPILFFLVTRTLKSYADFIVARHVIHENAAQFFFFLSSIEHCEKAEGTLFVYFEYPLLLSSRSSTALVCNLARFVTCRLLEFLLEVDMACRDLTVKLNPYIKFKLIKLAITLYQEF